jgi:hypothetical protein
VKLPGYKIDGKCFATVRGLVAYLIRKHNASGTSCIGSDHLLHVHDYEGMRLITVATYRASDACALSDTQLTLEPKKNV